MADGIGRIFGGSSYGVGGYIPQRKEETVETNEQQAQVQQNFQETQVDPNKVMDFLANNNYFMPVTVEAKPVANIEAAEVDAETQDSIAGYMERFEEIYSVVENEFGAQISPAVMDLVMDNLMGMV